MMRRAAIFAMALTAAQAAHAGQRASFNAPGQFAPRDECAAVPGAPAFLAALRRAVSDRDSDALAALAAPDVLIDFGGGAGREELKVRLGAEGGALWGELDRLLALGCASGDAGLTLPWFFAQDLGEADPFAVFLATGSDVPMRAGPEETAKVLARLSWQLVAVEGDFDPDSPFVHVRLLQEGTSGYVAAERLRSPIDYRLIAEGERGSLAITALVAGD